MHIGQVAKATGASPKAIRLYEEIGLLPQVRRRGAYRVYTANEVQLVQWIRQAQALGFKLAELGALQGTLGEPDWMRIAEMIDAKRERVRAEIARLTTIAQRLGELGDELRGCDSLAAPVAACDAHSEISPTEEA